MAKRKTVLSAARSLLLAVLCLGLLVGTTFAWFSDEAKTGDTKITAGNLDVELYHVKPETVTDHGGVSSGELGKKFGADEQLFDIPENFLWEPGAMWESEPFAVKNEGTLTLQYTLTVKVEKDPAYTGDLDLSERIKMKFAPAKSTDVGGEPTLEGGDTQEARKQYWDKLGEGSASAHGVLRPGLNSSAYIAVLYWEPADSTSVDDFEANPDNKFNLGAEEYENGAPSVIFSLDVFATQYPDEEDSFGPDYDAGIVVATTTEELKDAIENAGNGDIIELDPSGGEVIKSSAFGKLADLPEDVKELTIAGVDPADKTVVDVVETPTSYGSQQYGVLVNGNTERTVTFSNLKFDGSAIDGGKWGGVVGVGGSVDMILENVEVTGTVRSNDWRSADFNACVSKSGSANLTLRGCYLHGATRGILAEGHGEVLIEDCTIENRRPLYIDSGDMTFTVKDSRILGGRTAFSKTASGESTISFENTTFSLGNDKMIAQNNWVGSFCDNVTFTGCTFNEDFAFDGENQKLTVNFNGCKTGETALSADNVKALLKQAGQLTVNIDGEAAVTPAAE